jgi:hypothetical protein
MPAPAVPPKPAKVKPTGIPDQKRPHFDTAGVPLPGFDDKGLPRPECDAQGRPLYTNGTPGSPGYDKSGGYVTICGKAGAPGNDENGHSIPPTAKRPW